MSLTSTPEQSTQKLDELSNVQIAHRINIIAKILIWLSCIWFGVTALQFMLDPASLSVSSSQNNPVLDGAVMLLQLLVGIGLLRRQVWAYYTFRVLGVLALIGAVFMLLAVVAILPLIGTLIANLGSFVAIAGMIGLGLTVVTYGFWIYGLFVTNTPAARALFR